MYFRKAVSKTLSFSTKNAEIKISTKISVISKIRCIIYRSVTNSLQTRTVPFPDEEKILEQVDGG